MSIVKNELYVPQIIQSCLYLVVLEEVKSV